jgi:peptidyl-prolyl cis-trans isomerase SurA
LCLAVLAVSAVVSFVASAMIPAAAQQILNIRAVVNDEAISAFDVEQRLTLVLQTSGLPDNAQTRSEISRRIIDSMVDETLQLQEAKRLNIKVTTAEIDNAISLIEKQNNFSPGSMDDFLKRQGIDKRTLVRQIESSLAWSAVVRRQLLRTVSVTDDEINKTLARIKENAGKPRILAAEIFIAVDSPRDEANARNNAQRIFDELRRGANFPQMARQFSQAASAERGGDLGWVVAGELEPELDKVLAKLPKGATSEPFRTLAGYYIVAVRDRREPQTPSAADAVIALRQILLPLPAGAPPAAVASQTDLAETIRGSVRGCADFSAMTKELGTGLSGDLGRLKLSELPGELRTVVASLETGVPSAPVVTGDSVRVLMVCDRVAPADANAPKREEIERRLIVQRLELRARRYLRDLRDAAFLDIRA